MVIELRLSRTESYNSIGNGEKYHERLRQIYQNVELDFPEHSPGTGPSIATKAMKYTMISDDLVPLLLVLGVFLRLPTAKPTVPDPNQTMKSITMASREIKTIVAQKRLQTFLCHNIPYVSNVHLKVGDEILIYRVRKNIRPIRPYKIPKIDDKKIHVHRN